MNLEIKKNELIKLITEYLENQIHAEELRNFSWKIIEYFNKSKKNELPPHESFEKEFWYTIWQIQHLADEKHEKEGVTKKVLLEALEYLKKTKRIPDNFIGCRP